MRSPLLACLAILAGCSSSESSSTPTLPVPDAAPGDAPSEVADVSLPDAADAESSVDSPQEAAEDGAFDADSATQDAPDATAAPQRCGAAPFSWLPADAMGNVLQAQDKAPHSKYDLGLALLKMVNDGALKTTRLPQYNTKQSLIRYQTQDRGKLVDATALVTWPDEGKTFPIMLFLHGTAGFHDACAPTLEVVDAELGGFTSGSAMLLSLYASFGYITVFPDYIGLKSLGAPTGFMHPYLQAEPTAIASLDSVRAAKKRLGGESALPGDVVVIGGSQGGHAAAFVNRYQPYYAPELAIRGAVWDVPPTDILGQSRAALTTNWVSASDNVGAFLAAADSWFGAAPGGLSEVFVAPLDTDVPVKMMSECGGLDFDNPTLQTVYTPQILAAAADPAFGDFHPWDCYMKENSLPTTSLPRADDVPALFLLGELDGLVNNTVERASFQTLCSQGMRLVYLECAGASHTAPLVYAFDQGLDFLQDRVEGKPLPADMCVVKPAEKCTSQP